MATYYIDSNTVTGGNGSISSPFKTLASLTLSDGDTVFLKRNSVFREQLLASTLAANNLTFADYGEGDKPKITGALYNPVLTYEGNNIYSYSVGSNLGGNILENGSPLKWKAWNTNINTTALVPGSFTFDYTGFKYYIYPSTPNVLGTYSISIRLLCVSISGTYTGLSFTNICFEQASRHAVTAYSRTNLTFDSCEFYCIGGYRSGSTHLGNGLEISYDCVNFQALNCTFKYIFDSAGTSQLYEVTAASLQNHLWKNNKISYCGLAGIEISTQTNNQTIANVRVENNNINYIGNYTWLSLRTGVSSYGIGLITNGTSCVFNSIFILKNTITNCPNYAIVNTVGTQTIPARSSKNYIEGPCIQAFRLNNTNYLEGNIVKNTTYGVYTVGSGSCTIYMYNNVFDSNFRTSFRDNTNSFFVTKNNIFINNDAVHAGNFSGNYTGTTNCVYNNRVLGASYSSTGDITTKPLVDTNYSIKSNSPCVAQGSFVSYSTDKNSWVFNNPPSIGAFEYIAPRGIR